MIRPIQFTLMTLAFATAMSAHAADSEVHSTVQANQLHLSIIDKAASTTCVSEVNDTIKKYAGDFSSCATVVPVKLWVNSSDPSTDKATYESSIVVNTDVVKEVDKNGGTDAVQNKALAKLEKQYKNISAGCYGKNVTIVVKSDSLYFDIPATSMARCTAVKLFDKFRGSKYGQQAMDLYSQTAKETADDLKYLQEQKAKALAASAQKARDLANYLEQHK